ncbi:MAG: methyl-accepting chemotaxis protein [Treponema sp.]|nr:methyl-accepting chemotaxis protein [Treponema sp.]
MIKFKSPKLSHKLVLGMTLFSLLSLGAAFFVVNSLVRNVVYENIIGVSRRDKIINAAHIDAWLAEGRHIVDNLAGALLSVGLDHIYDLEKGLMREHDFLDGVYIGFSDGSFSGFSGWTPDAPWDSTTRPWFIDAVAAGTGKTVIVRPYISAATGGLVTAIARSLGVVDGKIAVAAIDIRLDAMKDMLATFDVAGGGYLFLMDAGGRIIVHPNADFMPTIAGYANIAAIAGYTQIFDRFAVGEETVQGMDQYGIPSYFMQFHLDSADWTLVAIIPTAVTGAPVRQMLSTVMLSIILALAIVTGFSLALLSKKFIKPILLLTKNLDNTANGELTYRLPECGNDEIGRASRSFNKTMEELGKMVSAIKSQTGTLSEIGDDLADNMSKTASAMNQIATNIQSIKGKVINQSSSVIETKSTMEQVTANIDKLSGHVALQAGAVSESSSAVEEMIASIQSVTSTLVKNAASVRELEESAVEGRRSLQEVARDIEEIALQSEGLSEINSMMQNIASQTNLLSMNAAIEAAHAGHAGKGFAVVSGEIRKLAVLSGDQSKTVATVLKKIKEAIDHISRSTDNVLQRFEAIDRGVKTVAEQEENIRSAMEEQSRGTMQILQVSTQVNEITQQVKGGSVEMLQGSREVILESANLEKATMEITVGVNEMADGAMQVDMAVSAISGLTGKTKENISTLVQAVSMFKV